MATLRRIFALTVTLGLASLPASPQTPVPMSMASLKTCSNAGVAECEFKLAQATESGIEVTRDLNAAKALYERAYAGGVEAAGTSLLRLMKTPPETQPPEVKLQPVVAPATAPRQAVPITIQGITYGVDGLPVGFEHTSLEQNESEFGRQFRASECIHYGVLVRCEATFKAHGETIRIAAWFTSGRMFTMAQLIRKGCADHSTEFSKRMQREGYDNTAFMAAAFLPSGIYNFSHSAVISAWSSNDTLHALTACEKNDSGMLLLTRESLTRERELARLRAEKSKRN